MADLFGLPMSLGTIANLEHATVQALAAPVAEAQTLCPRATRRASATRRGGAKDEPARGCGSRSPRGCTVFVVRLSRGAKVAAGALGRAVLRHLGDGSLECIHVVSHAMAASLLGASAARL